MKIKVLKKVYVDLFGNIIPGYFYLYLSLKKV